MAYNKIKNGFRITVKKWSNVVTVSDTTTNKLVKSFTFSDHVTAVLLAKKI